MRGDANYSCERILVAPEDLNEVKAKTAWEVFTDGSGMKPKVDKKSGWGLWDVETLHSEGLHRRKPFFRGGRTGPHGTDTLGELWEFIESFRLAIRLNENTRNHTSSPSAALPGKRGNATLAAAAGPEAAARARERPRLEARNQVAV